ncbi:hypothetical protein NDI54_17160 [Haloarcula sp. S1AR25-5A]|uniref:Uncharacterized protein n=1 Tax=Haloarcula terrestris TaxID=2950533 RepID=A0AAE4F1W4_9EURY|nr:hypothetical protein [Haloarcula terrestris]MDS0223078.1 hypothetical protein [Haloarcula terrestris]
MDQRTARLLNGLLALCCLTLVFAAVYPFTTASPHAANPSDSRFTVPESDEYRATGSIVVDGETAFGFEGAVTRDGGRYQFVDEGDMRTEQYQASPDSPVYSRIVVEADGRIDQRREEIRTDTDHKLLRENRSEGTVTFIVRGDAENMADGIAGTASVVVGSLYVTGYERTGVEQSGAGVYEPKGGWYEGTEPYRVTAATGEVRTASDTTAVRSATVTWDQTIPAGTYAEFALVRLTSNAPQSYALSFEFAPGETTVQEPAWVPNTGPESQRVRQ